MNYKIENKYDFHKGKIFKTLVFDNGYTYITKEYDLESRLTNSKEKKEW